MTVEESINWGHYKYVNDSTKRRKIERSYDSCGYRKPNERHRKRNNNVHCVEITAKFPSGRRVPGGSRTVSWRTDRSSPLAANGKVVGALGKEWTLVGFGQADYYLESLMTAAEAVGRGGMRSLIWSRYFASENPLILCVGETVLSTVDRTNVLFLFSLPQPWRAPCGLRVVRIDPLRFLAGCRTRRLNQV